MEEHKDVLFELKEVSAAIDIIARALFPDTPRTLNRSDQMNIKILEEINALIKIAFNLEECDVTSKYLKECDYFDECMNHLILIDDSRCWRIIKEMSIANIAVLDLFGTTRVEVGSKQPTNEFIKLMTDLLDKSRKRKGMRAKFKYSPKKDVKFEYNPMDVQKKKYKLNIPIYDQDNRN